MNKKLNLYFLELSSSKYGLSTNTCVRNYEKLTLFNAERIMRENLLINTEEDMVVKWSYLSSTGYTSLSSCSYIVNMDFANGYDDKTKSKLINHTTFGELYNHLNKYIRDDKIDSIID